MYSSKMTYAELEIAYDSLRMDYARLKKENALLKQYERIYRIAIGMTTSMVSLVNIPKRTLAYIFNERSFTGLRDNMDNVPESILSTGIIHPDDCDEYRRFFHEIYAGTAQATCTVRIHEENGGWIWFSMCSQTMYDSKGNPQSAIILSDDITAKKKAELQYQNYKSAVTCEADYTWEANLTKDMLILDDEVFSSTKTQNPIARYSEFSEKAFSTVPKEFRESVRQTFGVSKLLNDYANARREVVLEYPVQMSLTGKVLWLQSTAYLTANYEGDICVIITSKDITKNKLKADELQSLARRDPLCGLYNRRFFESSVKKRLSVCQNERPVLLIIDVDDFKQVNDRWGHAFGDQVLRKLASSMIENFRQGDLLARVGGDEYMVFVPDTIPQEALADKLASLQESIKNIPTPDGNCLDIHLSIGGALYQSGNNFEQMYRNADSALYEAKNRGKNQFIIFSHSNL